MKEEAEERSSCYVPGTGASSAGLRSQEWSERDNVATISPEFLGWVFGCEVLVVIFRKQVNSFQGAGVFYRDVPIWEANFSSVYSTGLWAGC